jgi:hypothetical protein
VSGRGAAAAAAAAAVVTAVAALTATALPRTAFSMYDEGVYYYQSVLFARGRVPYRDFFAPQPPGLLMVGAACVRVGAGVTGVRAVNWLCGLVLLVLTVRLARRGGAEGTAPLAPVLVAVTVVFAYQSVQGATNMPAACLEAAAVLVLLGAGRRRFELAGAVLAAATALRLQSLVAAPGLMLLALVVDGRAGFAGRAARFLAGMAAGCATIHLPPALVVPSYVDNVIGFQLARVRTDWAGRAGQVREALKEPPVVLGLPAAAWLLARGGRGGRGGPAARGLAAHALTTAGLVTAAGNSLSVMYYLPVLPLFAACAAAALPARRALVIAAVVAVSALRGPAVVEVVRAIKAPDAEHAACVAAVREAPGDRVLAVDGRIAVLAGKDLPADSHATDPNALVQLDPARFHDWFDRMLPRADVVAATSQMVSWMSESNARHLAASGKRVVFDAETTRLMFRAKFPGAGNRQE